MCEAHLVLWAESLAIASESNGYLAMLKSDTKQGWCLKEIPNTAPTTEARKTSCKKLLGNEFVPNCANRQKLTRGKKNTSIVLFCFSGFQKESTLHFTLWFQNGVWPTLEKGSHPKMKLEDEPRKFKPFSLLYFTLWFPNRVWLPFLSLRLTKQHTYRLRNHTWALKENFAKKKGKMAKNLVHTVPATILYVLTIFRVTICV